MLPAVQPGDSGWADSDTGREIQVGVRTVAEKIFISYRRGGVKARTYRMADALKLRFGAENVFLDIESIAAGARFADVIRESIRSSTVILIMIGPNWVNMKRGDCRRLDDPEDNLRIEVETALKSRARVIPVLVNGAVMPERHELPAEIAELTELNAASLADSHWQYDVDRLIAQIDPYAAPAPAASREVSAQKPKLRIPALISLGLLAMILLVLIEDDYDQETMLGGATLAAIAFLLSAYSYFKARKDGKLSKTICIAGMVLGVLLLFETAIQYVEYDSFDVEYVPDGSFQIPY